MTAERGRTAAFYDRFADKYDLMVSDERYEEVLPFFVRVLKKHHVKSVLDCACGTGKHAARLAQAGFDVTGCDVSAEMIRRARRNAETLGVDVDFVQADFKRLAKVFNRTFDGVLCWGNSLNHELDERRLRSALRSMRHVLRDNGVLLIQIRNLGKWVREGRRIFPMHFHKEPNGDRKLFLYVLDFHRTRIRFNVLSFLEFNGKPTFDANSVDYRIVSAPRLRELLRESGYSNVRTYGDVHLARFSDAHSEDLIVVCTK